MFYNVDSLCWVISDTEAHHEMVVPSLVPFSSSDDFQREEQFGTSMTLANHPFNPGE